MTTATLLTQHPGLLLALPPLQHTLLVSMQR